jgi:hypothetical protein
MIAALTIATTGRREEQVFDRVGCASIGPELLP